MSIDLGNTPVGTPPTEEQKSQIRTALEVLPLAGGTMGEDAVITFANNSRLKEGTTDAGLGGAGGIAMVCSLDYEMKWEAGRLYIMEQDGFTIRVELFSTTPDINDDASKGYSVNSIRITTSGISYKCIDANLGGAIWEIVDINIKGAADIETILDGYYGGPSWRNTLTGSEIVSAINSNLGNVWSMRAYERAPIFNIQYPPVNYAGTEVLLHNGTEVTINGQQWFNGFIPDGVSLILLTDCTFTWTESEYSWRFPSSTMNIIVNDATLATPFYHLIASIAQNPHWSTFQLSRTLDCSLQAPMGSGFDVYDSTTQSNIETLIAAGWTILTPGMNIPPSPWFAITSTGISNAVDIEGTGTVFIARGDGGVTLEGEGLYSCETASLNPADWSPISYSAGQWPIRASYSTSPSSIEFFVTLAGSTYYAIAP